jgi:hypothetical protein
MFKTKKISLILLVTLFTLLFSVQSVFAYSYIGHKWQDSHSPRYYFGSTYQSLNYQNLTNNAAADWTNTPTHVIIQHDSAGKISFSTWQDINSPYSGDTTYNNSWIPPFYILGAYCKINTAVLSNYTNIEVQSLIAHEMGHALGLGESQDVYALMDPYFSDRRANETFQPRADDINGLNNIYP